jgi:hypothetical protein
MSGAVATRREEGQWKRTRGRFKDRVNDTIMKRDMIRTTEYMKFAKGGQREMSALEGCHSQSLVGDQHKVRGDFLFFSLSAHEQRAGENEEKHGSKTGVLAVILCQRGFIQWI